MKPVARPLAALWHRLVGVSPATAALVVLLVSGLVATVWVMDGERHRQQAAKAQARQLAEAVANDLRLSFDRNLNVLDVMAALVHQGWGPVADFPGVAGQLLASHPDVLELALLPDGRVSDRVPTVVSPADREHVLVGPGAQADALKAQLEGRLVVSPATDVGGRWVVVAYQPVFLGVPLQIAGSPSQARRGAFWGFVRVRLNLSSLLGAGRLDRVEDQGFDYRLDDPLPNSSGNARVLAASGRVWQAADDPVVVPLELYDLGWRLQVAPKSGWHTPRTLMMAVFWAALFSLGSAGLVYLLMQRMQLTRSLLQNLTDHVPGALYQYRLAPGGHAHFRYMSPGVEAIMGLSHRELRKSDATWREQLVWHDRRAMAKALQVSAQELTPFVADFRMRLPSGEVRWYWTKAQPQREPDGGVVWNGYLADWTHEKRTQDALAQSGQLLAEAQEVARLGYFITDVQTGSWTSSALLDDIFGIDGRFERTAAGWTSLVEPAHRDAMRDAYQRAVAEKSGFNVEYPLRRPQDGRVIWVHVMGRLEFDDKGAPSRIVGTVQDISQRKKAEDDIRNLAFYDPLTGLPNRRLLTDRLSHALSERALDHTHGALMFIDLDNFKDLNDTLGHDKGDALLRMVALRLLSCVRELDTVARLGGDEFVLLLSQLDLSEGGTPESVARVVGERVLAALARPYPLAGTHHTSTPSIRVTLFADEGLSVDEVLKRADVAMYQSKAAGRNTLRFYDPAIQAEVAERLQLAEDLRAAIVAGHLFLQYQPQHDVEGRLVGAEALLRWRHPVRGLVSPAVFIPLAEQVGLMEALGQWVLHTGCQQLRRWLDEPTLAALQGRFTLALNVSAHQFRSATVATDVARALSQAELPPGVLKLELTESLMVHDVEDIITKMNAIRPLGVLFSLDDFGTGYSSLTYLKRLPLDQLKIDQSFITDLLSSANDAAIARTVVALGQTLGLEVIAEGVETAEQCEFLQGMGCRVYQGYLFSRPLDADDFIRYAQAHLD